MSVDYYILKVDGKEYCDWIAKFNLAALDEEEYEKAIQEKAAISTEVNTALYPPELHSHVAIALDEIVKRLRKVKWSKGSVHRLRFLVG